MKKIIFLLFVCVIVLSIYYNNLDNRIFYVHIGNNFVDIDDYVVDRLKEEKKFENFVSYYDDKYRIIDIIRAIESNIKINDRTIQNALIKSDITLIEIGNNEINSGNFSEENIKELKNDLTTLFSLLRKNTKEKIVFFSLFKNEASDNTIKINLILKKLCDYYDIIYIDIYKEVLNKSYIDGNSKYLNLLGNKYVFNKFEELLEN